MKKLLSIIVSIIVIMSSFGFVACNNEGSLFGDKADVTYSVTVTAPENGSLIADKNTVKVGEDVTFSVTPNTGYVLAGLYLNGGKAEVNGNSYTVESVLRDYIVTAEFAKETVNVEYVGDGADAFSGKVLSFGDTLGELPTPMALGQYFIGWENEDGKMVTEYDKVTDLDGELILTAVYGEYTEQDKQNHIPFSISASYYDMAATKYGVAWHTRVEPVTPVLLAVEGDGLNWENADSFEVETFNWAMTPNGDEWICSGVVENLKFDTTYSVKFGDYSVNAWSDVYTFTTREEYPEDVSFVYMTDTQQIEPTPHWDGKTYSRTHYTVESALTRCQLYSAWWRFRSRRRLRLSMGRNAF